MTGRNATAAKLSATLRMGLLASTAVAAVLAGGEAARAACNPAADNNVTATCTGNTLNQGADAPGSSLDINGYGHIVFSNLNVTIVPGATITGTTAGIIADSTTVANSGVVAGGVEGLYANTVTVTNSGTITGAMLYGIITNTANVTNSGTITGGNYGVRAITANVTNSGTITGANATGIHAVNAAIVTNSGDITGGDYGISGNTAVVTNSGTITGSAVHGIFATTTANVTNSGTVTGGGHGIFGTVEATVTNSGTITGTSLNGISTVTANVSNSGTITGGGRGINADTTATVANSGSIAGGDYGIVGITTATVTNSGTITGTNFYGVTTDTANVINSGAITGGVRGINADTTATVANSGTIAGGVSGVYATTMAAVANSGTIAGGFEGIQANTVTVTNSGTITGANLYGIIANTANVTNSGTIAGGNYGIRAITVNVTNSGTITGTNFPGIHAVNAATVTNSGAINGGTHAIFGNTAIVTNSGTITGSATHGINTTTTANVTNSGAITGADRGINAGTMATVANSGRITGGSYGVRASTANLTNSGAISGGINGVNVATSGDVTNSGTITGTGGTAIQFNANGTAASDSLTVLPGARFGGLVNFGGGADTVKFGPGSWVLNTANFNAALSTVTTSGNAYVVTANQIIVADFSGFGTMNRAVMDITGWIASVLPDTPVFAPVRDGANAFAAIEAAAPRFDHAFGIVSEPSGAGAMAYAPTAPLKGGSVTDRDGNSVWAKGFGGRREQATDGSFTGSVTIGYGGAIGYDRQITPDTRLGGFIGGSANETTLDQNAGRFDTDTLFGGLYARSFLGATFLDLALIGGKLSNEAKRNIGGGPALETASASYGGAFVNPSLALGHRFALDRFVTVTPALKVRYVAAQFDGYTETGSSTNLTVGDRTMQAFEERAEVTLANTRTLDNGSRLGVRMTGGLLAQQRTGDATVNIALVGQNFIGATPDKPNTFGIYGGAGLDWQIGRMTLFAAGEVTGMDDNITTVTGKGGVRVAW